MSGIRPGSMNVNKQFKSPLVNSRGQLPGMVRPAMGHPPSVASSSQSQEVRRMPPPAPPPVIPPPPKRQVPAREEAPSPPAPVPKPPQNRPSKQSERREMPPPPPLQRELSQPMTAASRRRLSAVNLDVLPPPAAWRAGNKVGKAIFECGLALYADKQGELYVEGSLFRRELAKKLGPPNNEINPDELVQFVEDFMADRGQLLRALLPTTLKKPENDEDPDANPDQQQSFLRLLLGIDAIQQKIAEGLLLKLIDVAEPMNENDRYHSALVGVDMPYLIVSQFKWLEHIAEPDKMIALFLDAIKFDDRRIISTELISALPEIFGDSQHPAIVEKLRPLLTQRNSPYLADILDTFSNLNVEPETVDELRTEILDGFGGIAVDSTPAALKFILSTVTPENAFEIVVQVRERLEIDDEDYVSTFSREQQQSLFKLIFSELKSALLLNSCQMTSWTKHYSQQPPPGSTFEALRTYEIRPFDFAMLVILHAVSFKKKAIENILRTRRRLELVSDKTVETAFKRYHAVLGDHLRAVVGIADSCVRTADSTICSFGSLVYKQAFCEFDNVCVRQDIVANLVTHVFSLPISSTNCAMDILLALSEEKPGLLVCFRVFVRNMLDVLDNLHLSDVRKLYRILANLAFADSVALSSVERTRFKDDLYLIIRKQLAFAGPENTKYRQFGVLAAAMLARGIGQWAKTHPDSDKSAISDGASTSSDEQPRGKITTEILELFNLVQRSVASNDSGKSKDVASLGLFYDELSILVKSGCLPIDTINWLSQNLPERYTKNFLKSNKTSLVNKIDGLYFEQDPFFLAVHDTENEYPTVMVFEMAALGVQQPNRKGADIYHLCPLFRLLAECNRVINGDDDILSAQLACPVNFPTLMSIRRLRKAKTMSLTEQYAICESFLAIINWFRELISIFGASNDSDIRGHCLQRLHDTIPLANELEELFKACPSWVPRFITDSIFNSSIASKGRPQKTKAKKDPKKQSKSGAKKAKIVGTQHVGGTQVGAKSQAGPQTQALGTQAAQNQQVFATNFAVMARFRVAFRELSLDALQLISGDISRVEGATSSSLLQMTSSSANSSFSTIFTPQEALYLVEDLIEKLKYKLIKAGSKAFGAFAGIGQVSEIIHRSLDEKTTGEVLDTVVGLVGPMCSLLQGCYVMVHEALSESGGTLDGLDGRAEWTAGLKLYTLIFDCFAMLLVNVPQLQPDLVGKLLFSIANSPVAQNNEIPRTPSANSDNICDAFKFLRRFSDCLPTLLIAGSYLRTMEALLALCKRGNSARSRLSTEIYEICEGLLKADWTDAETQSGSASFKVISHIFQSYLVNAPVKLSESLRTFIDLAESELSTPGAGPEAKSLQFRTLSRRTFPAFYEVIMAKLVQLAQTTPSLGSDGLTASQQQQRPQPSVEAGFLSQRHHIIPDVTAAGHVEMLRGWDDLGNLFKDAVELVKTFSTRNCILPVIKHGRTFLDIFSKRGMPLLDVAFQAHANEVREILSVVQKGTRVLHIVCSESKSNKEVTILALVPRLKKVLEAFLFRVKQMLSVNNCLESFFFGILKARNIQGDEISSQNPYNEEAEEEEPPKKKRASKKQEKVNSQPSEEGEEDEEGDGETLGEEDTEEEGEEGSEEGESENEEDEDRESTTVGDSESFDDAADTLASSMSSSTSGRKRSKNTSNNKKRFSYSTAYDPDEEVSDLEDSADY